MATKKKTVEDLVNEQTEYKPETYDGDNDGLVQDGTKYERAIDTHIVQSNNETWVSISELYRGTKNNYSYAKELIAKNSNVSLNKGVTVKL